MVFLKKKNCIEMVFKKTIMNHFATIKKRKWKNTKTIQQTVFE